MMKSLSFKKTNLIIPWIGGLVLAGIGVSATFDYWESQSDRASKLIASQTVLVKSQDLTVQIQADGTVEALRTTNLSPEAPGRIAELYIKEGDRVTSRQVIARMSSDHLQAQVNRARASLQKAQANLALVKAGKRR